MKDIIFLAYSEDKEFLKIFNILLKKIEAKIILCDDYKKLTSHFQTTQPDILLIDKNTTNTKTETKKITSILENFFPNNTRETSIVIILTEDGTEIETKVNLLLTNADYIIEKPIIMVEFIAKMIAIVRHQHYIHNFIDETFFKMKNITKFEIMETVLVYLNEHIKPKIDTIINDMPIHDIENSDIEHNIKKFCFTLHEGALQMMATINSIRDEVHNMMQKPTEPSSSLTNLETLYQKNLELIQYAYQYNEKSTK